MQDLTKEDLESAERIGFPIVLLILLAVFGSLAAAALPLALGFASVSITGAAVYFLSQATPMSVFVTNIASMIGIGVAVDYSLFVLARYREEIRGGRRAHRGAQGRAAHLRPRRDLLRHHRDALPGRAVSWSTPRRSARWRWARSSSWRSRSSRRSRCLPVLMSVLGRRAYARGRLAMIAALLVRMAAHAPTPPGLDRGGEPQGRVLGALDERRHAPPVGGGARCLRRVARARHPGAVARLRQRRAAAVPADNETRVGAELAAQKAGPGATGPTQVMAELDDGRATDSANRAGAQLLRERAAARPRGGPGLAAPALA